MEALISIVHQAGKKVPAVYYAFGLVGIAACGALISGILKVTGAAESGRTAIIVLGLTFIGSVILLVFAKLAASNDPAINSAGRFFVWVVVVFFTMFMVITTTAFITGLPTLWAEFLGIANNSNKAACQDKVKAMWLMLQNESVQSSDVEEVANSVEGCDPFQAATVKGALAFYSGRFYEAVKEFDRAHKLMPDDDPISRNLSDAYVEVGRYQDAVSVLEHVKRKDALWSYKYARVKYYLGDLSGALALVAPLPTALYDDGNIPGKARILQSAIIVESTKQSSAENRDHQLQEASKQFKEGYFSSREKWAVILRNTKRSKYEGFEKQAEVLAPYLEAWTVQ